MSATLPTEDHDDEERLYSVSFVTMVYAVSHADAFDSALFQFAEGDIKCEVHCDDTDHEESLEHIREQDPEAQRKMAISILSRVAPDLTAHEKLGLLAEFKDALKLQDGPA